MLDVPVGSTSSRDTDLKLENQNLLHNGVLHVNSRSIVFDSDARESTLPELTKFRYNQRFDMEMVSGDNLEQVHSQILEMNAAKNREIPTHLLLLDYFYKYLMFQTFPEVLSPSLNWSSNGQALMEDYSQILDRSSYTQFQQDLQEM